jgi:putative flippase GtrA
MKTKRSKKIKKKSEVVRFLQYSIGGSAQFWSGYGAFAFLDLALHVPFWPNKIFAYFFGVTINFAVERFWVFKVKKVSKRQVKKSAQRYYSLMFIDFLLDLAIVGGLRQIGISPYLGQFASAGFFVFWNYIIFKIWVFHDRLSRRRYA